MKFLFTLSLLAGVAVCMVSCDEKTKYHEPKGGKDKGENKPGKGGNEGNHCKGDHCHKEEKEDLCQVDGECCNDLGHCCKEGPDDVCDKNYKNDYEHICTESCDTSCFGEYINKFGTCEENHNPKGSAVIQKSILFKLSSIRTTVITPISYISGLDSIKSIEVKKNKYYITIIFRLKEIVCRVPDALFAFSKESAEPKVIEDSVTCRYNEPRIIARIKCHGDKCIITDDSLKNAKIFAFINYEKSVIELGDKILHSDDPVVQKRLQELPQHMDTAFKEIWLTKSHPITMLLISQFCVFPEELTDYDSPVVKNIAKCGADDNDIQELCHDCDDVEKCFKDLTIETGTCVPVDKPKSTRCRNGITISIPNCFSEITRGIHIAKGVTAKIKKISFNKSTGNMVIFIYFAGVIFYAPTTNLTVFTKNEVLTTTGFTTAEYGPSITAVINVAKPGSSEIKITKDSLAKAYVDVDYLESWIDIDSKWKNCNNPDVQNVFKCLLECKDIVAREIFATEAHRYFMYFMDSICDFGQNFCSAHGPENFIQY